MVWPQLLAVIAMLKAVVCDEGTAALQRTSVVRVAAQQAGYFEYTGFLATFSNIPQPPKVYVDK